MRRYRVTIEANRSRTVTQHAIRAAKNRHVWGRFATLQYVNRHTTLRLYRIACQLEAMKGETA